MVPAIFFTNLRVLEVIHLNRSRFLNLFPLLLSMIVIILDLRLILPGVAVHGNVENMKVVAIQINGECFVRKKGIGKKTRKLT